MTLLLVACVSNPEADSETGAKSAWRECIFELDKVEAIRGRNLDDLDKGMAVARNQFMVDCMGSKGSHLLPEHTDDLVKYAGREKARQAGDLNLNDGKPRQ